MRPTYYLPIHGTWAIDEGELAWWKHKSEFAKYASQANMYQLPGYPFIWSSDLIGVWYNFFGKKTKLTDWAAGGWALVYYLDHIPYEHRNLIAHSHGLQVVLYAASYGLRIRNLISVCSPIRNDMHEISVIARPKIKNWLHIYDSSDRTQFWGQFGDGKLFGSRYSIHADVNHHLKGINHSDTLKKDASFYLWRSNGWFEFLRQQ